MEMKVFTADWGIGIPTMENAINEFLNGLKAQGGTLRHTNTALCATPDAHREAVHPFCVVTVWYEMP